MTDGLGPEARALLEAAREGLSPDPEAVRRVRARVQGAATGAAGGVALATKLAILAAVVVAVGTAVLVRRTPTPAAVPAVQVASPPERPQPVAVQEAAPGAAARSTAASAVVDADLITIEPMAPPPREPSQPRPAAPARRTGTAAGIELGREVALVDLAMAALRRGDAGGALGIVQQYVTEAAGAGQLTEDASAIEIEALCRLRDPGARDKLAAFDARFPRSAQRARLAAACR